MRNISDKSCRENRNTRFCSITPPPRKSCRSWDSAEKYCRAGQATDDNMAHAHCILDNLGYKHTLRICNTYCFSTATMVARTRLSVTLDYIACFVLSPTPFLYHNHPCFLWSQIFLTSFHLPYNPKRLVSPIFIVPCVPPTCMTPPHCIAPLLFSFSCTVLIIFRADYTYSTLNP